MCDLTWCLQLRNNFFENRYLACGYVFIAFPLIVRAWLGYPVRLLNNKLLFDWNRFSILRDQSDSSTKKCETLDLKIVLFRLEQKSTFTSWSKVDFSMVTFWKPFKVDHFVLVHLVPTKKFQQVCSNKNFEKPGTRPPLLPWFHPNFRANKVTRQMLL